MPATFPYLCKLLTYGHQICIVDAPDMDASTSRQTHRQALTSLYEQLSGSAS